MTTSRSYVAFGDEFRLSAHNWKTVKDAVGARPSEMKWLSIPWETNLERARAKAQRHQLPIFFWAMNGNPLGCV